MDKYKIDWESLEKIRFQKRREIGWLMFKTIVNLYLMISPFVVYVTLSEFKYTWLFYDNETYIAAHFDSKKYITMAHVVKIMSKILY